MAHKMKVVDVNAEALELRTTAEDMLHAMTDLAGMIMATQSREHLRALNVERR